MSVENQVANVDYCPFEGTKVKGKGGAGFLKEASWPQRDGKGRGEDRGLRSEKTADGTGLSMPPECADRELKGYKVWYFTVGNMTDFGNAALCGRGISTFCKTSQGDCLTGGGGKTSVMFRLADELADMGEDSDCNDDDPYLSPGGPERGGERPCFGWAEWLARNARKPDRSRADHGNGTSLLAGVPAAEGKRACP